MWVAIVSCKQNHYGGLAYFQCLIKNNATLKRKNIFFCTSQRQVGLNKWKATILTMTGLVGNRLKEGWKNMVYCETQYVIWKMLQEEILWLGWSSFMIFTVKFVFTPYNAFSIVMTISHLAYTIINFNSKLFIIVAIYQHYQY